MTPSTQPNVAPDIGLTMTQILRSPLSALRTSMETLASEFHAEDPRSLKLSGALEQVLAMSHDVEALMQLATPRPLAPLTCSLDEIVEAALRRQRFEQRARVRLARPSGANTLRVDGPLLADCLARLLEYVLATTHDTVLLSTRCEEHAATFSIVAQHNAEGELDHELSPSRRAALELGLTLARRDAVRMNAVLDVRICAQDTTCLSIRVDEDNAAA